MVSFRSERRPRWRLRLLLLVMFLAIPFLLASPKPMTASMVADSENGTKVLVLNYHKVDNMNISLSVLPEDFDRQMKYLSENGYHTITPDELYDSLAGNAELPENPVLINAYPILKKSDFKATIFVISSFLGVYPNYLTWDQAREMDANGISIQSHTVDHKSMTDLSDDELRAELVNSKKKIEKELGHSVDYMAYPTGTYNLHIAELVKEAGYKAAFTIKYGNVDKASNIYALEHVPVFHTEDTNKSFLERIRYTPIFERFGWIKS